MRNGDRGDGYPQTPPVRRCGHCGEPMLTQRKRARYCGRRCKELARESRKRAGDRLTTLRRNHPFADVSLAELHEQARPPKRRAGRVDDDLNEFSDYHDVPRLDDRDRDTVPERAGHDLRINAMLQAEAGQRTPRRSWWELKRFYSANPGVELPEINRERIERHKAGQAAVQARLRNSAGQPQDRFSDATKDTVGTRGIESRRLNRMYATADPRPASQRQEFRFEGESVNGGPYHRGRPSGQRPGHADYAWNMDDGFRF